MLTREWIGTDGDFHTRLQNVLRELCDGIKHSVASERYETLRRLKEADLLWKGQHYSTGLTGQAYGGVNYVGPGQYSNKRARYVLNYYKADCLKLVGLLGLPPAMKASLFDENPSILNPAAVLIPSVDQLISRIQNHWKLHLRIPDIIFMMYYAGNLFWRTSFTVDGFKFGSTQLPRLVDKPQTVWEGMYICPQCQNLQDESDGPRCNRCGLDMPLDAYQPPITETVPMLDGYDTYSNGGVVNYLADGYTTYTSHEIEQFDDVKWLAHDVPTKWSSIVATYKELQNDQSTRAKFKNADRDLVNSSPYKHSSTSSPDANAYISNGMHSELWLYPHMYEELIDTRKEVRDYLHVKYPYGVKIIYINNRPAYLEAERLHTVWAGARPTVGPSWYTSPLGENHASGNRLVNRAWNTAIEIAEKSIPLNLYNPSLLDMRKLFNSQAQYSWIPMQTPVGMRMADSIYTTTPVSVPPGLQQLLAQSTESMREVSNLNPSMFGAGPVDQTAAGTEIRRNMGMLPHSNTWQQIINLTATAVENGIRQYSTYSPGDYAMFAHRPGIVERVEVPRLKDLSIGGWYILPSEVIPLTHSQQRAQMDHILGLGTELLQFLGMDNPSNVRKIQDIIGLKGFKVAGYDNSLVVIEIIRNLLQGQPTMNPQTGRLEPSIPFEVDVDDHQLMFDSIRSWLQSPEAKRYKNTPGYANVLARMMQHKNYLTQMEMQAQMQQMAAEGGPGGPSGQAGPSGPMLPNTMPTAAMIPNINTASATTPDASGLPPEGLPLPEDTPRPDNFAISPIG